MKATFVDRKLQDDDDVRVVYQCKGWPLSVSLLCWLLLVEISDHMTYFFKHITPLISQIPYSLIFLPQGHCSQFGPTEYGGSLGWKKVGYCSGSQTPTASPSDYSGTCTYEKCVDGTASPSTSPSSSPSKGPTGSPSASPVTAPLTRRKLEVCTTEDVLNYSSSTDYEEGDVVRIGTTRFKCRGWPNGLWCNNSAYAPSLKPGIWTDAWSEDGNCLYVPPPPSQSPSNKSPTNTPLVSPTQNVSALLVISAHILCVTFWKKDTDSYFHLTLHLLILFTTDISYSQHQVPLNRPVRHQPKHPQDLRQKR